MNSFYSKEELKEIGFQKIGKNVLISRKSSIYNPENISIGDNVRIDDFCIMSGNIKLGNNIHISAYSALFGGRYGIEVMDYCAISSRCTLYALSDDYSGEYLTNSTIPDKFKNIIGGKVLMGKHSIIGASSVVLPNVKIEEGVAIGSCSLVLKNCEAWGIYVGTPAKRIKFRSNKLLVLESEFFLENNSKIIDK